MSLFYTNRDVRITTTKKRKRVNSAGVEVDREKYPCEWCEEGYDSETDVHVHKRVKHRGKIEGRLLEPTVCKICVQDFGSDDELVNHIKSSHLLSAEDAEHVHRRIYICEYCHQIYFNKQILSIHIIYAHGKKTSLKKELCPKCSKPVRVKNMWFHFQNHNIQSISCCPICLLKCDNRNDLSEHIKRHLYYYHCGLCLYETKVKDVFNVHMQAHSTNLHLSPNIAIDESLLWRCFVPRKRPKKNNYNFGLQGLRLPELQICVLCRGICRESEKAGHIAKYHLVDIAPTKKQYICECGEQFFNGVLLKHHVFKLKGNHKACENFVVRL